MSFLLKKIYEIYGILFYEDNTEINFIFYIVQQANILEFFIKHFFKMFIYKVSKVGNRSRGWPETSLFEIYYSKV